MARPSLEIGQRGKLSPPKRTANGGWTLQQSVCDPSNTVRRVSASGHTKRDAEIALEAKIERLSRMAGGGQITSESTMFELLSYWSAQLDERRLKDSSRILYRESAGLICEELRTVLDPDKAKHVTKSKRDKAAVPSIGKLKIRQFNPQKVIELQKAVKVRHGVSRARTVTVVLRQALDHAVTFGATLSNVAKAVPAVQKVTPKVVSLTREEISELMSDLRNDPKAKAADLPKAMELLGVTGLRTGELFALRWDDLDLDDRATATLSVTGTVVRPGGLRRQDEPKTESSRRALRIPKGTADWLLERRVESSTIWVMPNAAGGLRDPGNFRRAWRDFTGRHPRWEWVVPRTLRKTVATIIRDELDIHASQHQLGHSSLSTTETYYAALVTEGPEVAELMGSVFGDPAE